MRRFVLGVSVALLVAGGLHAQSFTTGACNGDEGNSSNNSWFFGHQTKVCEIRRTTLPMSGQVNVAGTNGGIEVIGEDRRDIALEVKVTAQGWSHEAAEEVLRQIQVKTGGTIEATGPKFSWWSWSGNWSASYKLRVPQHLAADLRTVNGGIELTGVDGVIHVETVNGGLSLSDLAGEVHAETVNGGMHVALNGDQWRGAGLWAKTVNGGVSVKAQDHYSAHLVVETVNGGISVGFPITVQGKIGSGHHIDANLGDGGPTIEFQTVNGGVRVGRDQEVQ
jgi:hypothetical protein